MPRPVRVPRVGRAPLVSLALACIGSLGCAEGEASPVEEQVTLTELDLADPNAWRAMEASEDPFPDRPATVECLPTAFGVDAGAFGVYTGGCNYITATQPLRRALVAGDTIVVEAGYGTLVSTSPGEGHLSIALPGLTLLELRPAIPGPPQFFVKEIPVTQAIPAGTPLVFHVHNHGPNSWRLLRLQVVEAAK